MNTYTRTRINLLERKVKSLEKQMDAITSYFKNEKAIADATVVAINNAFRTDNGN